MHGIANLLSNCLIGLYKLLPSKSSQRKTFTSHMQKIHSSWSSQTALTPKQMKLFFTTHIYHELIPLFSSTQPPTEFKWTNNPSTLLLTYNQAVTMLFDALIVFYLFAYTRHPSLHDFSCLHISRTCILSCHHKWKWWQAPTTHYLLNHGILDAEKDKTAYFTLQEGVEHANHEDKEEARVTFKSSKSSHIPESHYMHIINQQQLRLHLTHIGYAPERFQLKNAHHHFTTTLSNVITQPKYTSSPAN